jgi:hypothetical protein
MKRVAALLVAVTLVALGSMPAVAGNAPSVGVTETVITYENEGCTVVGTLAMPTGVRGAVPAVLLFHGFTGTRNELPIIGTSETMYMRTARVLAEHGIASLRIDFCNSGESDGTYQETTFTGQVSDALAAVDWLDDQPRIGHIGIIGLSQGGLVASVTAATDSRVEAVVLWSAVANPPDTYKLILGADKVADGLVNDTTHVVLPWGAEIDLDRPFFEDLYNVDPVAAITGYSGPMQVVVGTRDTTVTPQPYYGQIYMRYHEGPEELVVLDGDHVLDVLSGNGPGVLDQAIQEALTWFGMYLRPKTS